MSRRQLLKAAAVILDQLINEQQLSEQFIITLFNMVIETFALLLCQLFIQKTMHLPGIFPMDGREVITGIYDNSSMGRKVYDD